MNTNPKSASSFVGGNKNAPNISWCPRGSNITDFLTSSRCSIKYCFFSTISLPGIFGIPAVTKRAASPAVCVSITEIILFSFIIIHSLIIAFVVICYLHLVSF